MLGAACAEPTAAQRARAEVYAALGEAIPGVSGSDLDAFERGREVALRRFGSSSGLGPEFNAVSCAGCHEKPTLGGAASRYRNVFVHASDDEQPLVGMQPQFVTDARVRAPDAPGFDTAVRSPVPLYGAGLLAEIPFEEIVARADPNDVDDDGISGRVNFERGFVGRFGRKAQMSTLTGFVRLALIDHLGVTTDAVEVDVLDVEEGPADLATRDADAVPDPELASDALVDLVTFVSLLAPPEPAAPTPETVRGRELFDRIGCTDCHVAQLLGPRGAIEAYTDLLLHDMGPAMRDAVAVGDAGPSEFRTQPLWSVGVSGPYLHDGRADSIAEAIAWHGGESEASQKRFAALGSEERAAVVAFVGSLGGDRFVDDGLIDPTATIPEAGRGGPTPTLNAADRERFAAGRRLFDHDFRPVEGLGPLFNGDSCRSCHFDPAVGGAGPADVDVIHHARVEGNSVVAPVSGTMVPRHATDGSRPAADATATAFDRRQTPTILGLGLLEAIPDSAIVAAVDPDDLDGDGVRGRARVLADGRLGRFGWKAQVPSLADFARDALSNELGLTVPVDTSPFGVTTDPDDMADPEIGAAEVEDLVFFMANLAPPVARPVPPDGEALFSELGCAGCHTPVLETAGGLPVRAYTDLLLHDVAPAGAVDVDAKEAGFRTPPLWGVVDTAPYLHDGSAETLEDAVRSHAGEAETAAEHFAALTSAERQLLLAFLDAL